jgi:hypothetical protein
MRSSADLGIGYRQGKVIQLTVGATNCWAAGFGFLATAIMASDIFGSSANNPNTRLSSRHSYKNRAKQRLKLCLNRGLHQIWVFQPFLTTTASDLVKEKVKITFEGVPKMSGVR